MDAITWLKIWMAHVHLYKDKPVPYIEDDHPDWLGAEVPPPGVNLETKKILIKNWVIPLRALPERRQGLSKKPTPAYLTEQRIRRFYQSPPPKLAKFKTEDILWVCYFNSRTPRRGDYWHLGFTSLSYLLKRKGALNRDMSALMELSNCSSDKDLQSQICIVLGGLNTALHILRYDPIF